MKKILAISMLLAFSHKSFSSENHETIYFGFDRSAVEDSGVELNNYPDGETVFWIKGYADTTGAESYNIVLAERRAINVKNAIINKYNLNEDQVKITSFGEDTNPNLANSRKRRSEVISGTADEISNLMNNYGSDVASNISDYDSSTTDYTTSYDSSTNDEPLVDESGSFTPDGEADFDKPYIQDSAINDIDQETDALIASDEYPSPDQDSNYSDDTLNDDGSSSDNDNFLVGSAMGAGAFAGRYYLGLGFYNNTLNSEQINSGAETEWTSGLNYNVEGQYQFKLKSIWLGLRASYHLQSYEVELDPTFDWNEDSPNLLNVALVADYEKEKWGLGLDIDYNQVPHVFVQGNDFEIRDVFMYGVTFRGQYKWLDKGRYTSRAGLNVVLPIGGSDDIEPEGDLGFIGFIDVARAETLKHYSLNLKLYAGQKNYANIQNEQSEPVVGLLFSLNSLNWL